MSLFDSLRTPASYSTAFTFTVARTQPLTDEESGRLRAYLSQPEASLLWQAISRRVDELNTDLINTRNPELFPRMDELAILQSSLQGLLQDRPLPE